MISYKIKHNFRAFQALFSKKAQTLAGPAPTPSKKAQAPCDGHRLAQCQAEFPPTGEVTSDGKHDIHRIASQYEIDFIVNTGREKVYIQSALNVDTEAKRNQETFSLKNSGDFFRKIIIVDGNAKATALGGEKSKIGAKKV